MNRRAFTLMALAALCAGGPALAASYQDQIVSQLKKQGYSEIRIQRTLLGRVRIVASGNGRRREIILNPRTGEILRDFWTDGGSSNSSGGRIIDSGRSGDDDNDDDDDNSGHGGGSDDDDDDDDDNSGSGSGNSGSGGGGNSGSGGGGDDGDDDD